MWFRVLIFSVLIDQFVHRYFAVEPTAIAGQDARGFIIDSVVTYALQGRLVPIRKRASCQSRQWRRPTNSSMATRQ